VWGIRFGEESALCTMKMRMEVSSAAEWGRHP
jgi:hypothetical protein